MRVSFLDLPIDILTMDETVDRALEGMRSRTRVQHVAVNVAKVVKAQSDAELREDIVSSDLIGVDGMGLVLGLRMAGIRVPERAAGIDLMNRLLEQCAVKGYRPYFLGATDSVVHRAAEEACRRYPGLVMAGIQDGYFTPEEEPRIVDRVRASNADCLFIGLPTPAKERLLGKYRDRFGVPFVMGVGGSFDVLSGMVSRAPVWVQKSGFEWLYRVLQEPRRLWWRYASTNAAFLRLMCSVLAQRVTTGKVH